jgi:large subunit ribosomal protein L21
VHEGSVLNVATVAAEPGSQVELRDVLMVTNGDQITVGSPTVGDAVVLAEVIEHGKARKVTNFKFKAKTRYRRKRGHRQGFTQLRIREISFGGVTASAPDRRGVRIEPERPAGFAGRVEAEAPVAAPASGAPPEPEAPAPEALESLEATAAETPETAETPARTPRRRRTQAPQAEEQTEDTQEQ